LVSMTLLPDSLDLKDLVIAVTYNCGDLSATPGRA